MAWSSAKSAAPVDRSLAYFLTSESNWDSAYPEVGGWVDALRKDHYDLSGEYAIDEHRTLYRFELDESHRDESLQKTPHFINVIINAKVKEPKLPVIIQVDKCPTCCKPI